MGAGFMIQLANKWAAKSDLNRTLAAKVRLKTVIMG